MNPRTQTSSSTAPIRSPRSTPAQSDIEPALPTSSHDTHVPLIASATPNSPERRRIWLPIRDRRAAWEKAQQLAKQSSRDLQRVDLSTVVSKYLRETEKNLLKIFDTAEESGAVLYFDEADALFGKRTSVDDAHDRYAGLERPYFLQLIENYPGSIILASERPESIDASLLNRYAFEESSEPIAPKTS